MKLFGYSILLLLITSFEAGYCGPGVGDGSDLPKNSVVHFSGNMHDIDSIRFTFFNYDSNDLVLVSQFTLNIGDKGLFSFDVPEILRIGKMDLVLYNNNIRHNGFDYVVEGGDSIYLFATIWNGNFHLQFSGKGAGKYTCTDELYNEFEQQSITGTEYEIRNGVEIFKPETWDHQVYEYTKARKRILQIVGHYHLEINPLALMVMKADILGRLSYCYDILVNTFYGKSRSDTFARVNALKIHGRKEFALQYYPKEITDMSSWYVDFALQKIIFNYLFDQRIRNPNYKEFSSYKEIYKVLKGRSGGALRDRILEKWIIYPNSTVDQASPKYLTEYFECVKDALTFLKNPAVRKSVHNMMVFSKGAKAFDFALPDTLGAIVKLRDLAGKVVLMDFWGTGCTPCAEFAKRFETDVYPAIIDKDKFVVVSVCSDKIKKVWQKSLRSGKYSSGTSINVFTAGQGNNHPMTRYYNFMRFPSILLIDKNGNVYQRIQPSESSERLIKLINSVVTE